MKTILAIFLTVLLLLPVSAIGEIQTVTHTVKQSFGGSQSPDDARISAVAKAKREALEMAGTYIESLTVVKNSQVDKDEILALAAGVLKAEVVSQKNYHTDDAFGIDVVVKVIVDTSVLEERVNKLLQDRTHLEQLNETRLREKELLKKIVVLEVENRKSLKSKQKSVTLQKEFQAVSKGLTAVDWVDKASALWEDVKYTDPQKAIEYLNEAIRLKPDYAGSYNNRGIAYLDLKRYPRAIDDFNEAIRLAPNLAPAYNNRGLNYTYLGEYQRAIKDLEEAIRLKPNDADAYRNRGRAYHKLKQYQRAIDDFDEAIRLNPDYANAYSDRGFNYGILKQYQRAIKDFDKVIRMKPNDADAYVLYNNRGMAYAALGKDQQAIMDFDDVIRLKPDLELGHFNRGLAYIRIGNSREGCRSLIRSCEIGNSEACLSEELKDNCR
ncbi:MAG: tetratricopeptide repeat protein [Syntrophales bacterium]